jgi:molybdenum cofactor synthesis domain-containing protein
VKSAALIVIGDEILTGKVKDENSFVFAQVMFDQGVRVRRIETIPDNIDDIAECIKKYTVSFDYVCTSGGVGPTHDDKTFDGIAHAFRLPLIEHKEALLYFQNEQHMAGRGDLVSAVQRKMLKFPSPCEVFFIKPLWLPLVRIKNVYVFPGVPFLFEKLIKSFSHLFLGGQFFRQTLFTDLSESRIAYELKIIQEQHPEVAIGSYPQMPGKSYLVMVTIEGIDKSQVDLVANKLLPLINARTIAE